MKQHDDLLELARFLATRGTGRPRQTDLRKAVSSAYYALFHRLVHDATLRLARGPDRAALREALLGRAFEHADMKAVARSFQGGVASGPIAKALNGSAPSKELVAVAACFAELQELRHRADYDPRFEFTRSYTRAVVLRVERAFSDLDAIRGALESDVFLTALLLGTRRIRP